VKGSKQRHPRTACTSDKVKRITRHSGKSFSSRLQTALEMLVTYKMLYLNSKAADEFACIWNVPTSANTFLRLGSKRLLFHFKSRQVVFFFCAYCTQSSCRTTAVAIPSLLPNEQQHNTNAAATCVAVKLSFTYLFTTSHHVIRAICFLLVFTSTTHGSCSLLHKKNGCINLPLSFVHYTHLWLGCRQDSQGILVRLSRGTTDFHLLRSPDRL
jgi:hypothetical protein